MNTNQYRSPLWDKNTYFIGTILIFGILMIIPAHILFNYLFKDSDVAMKTGVVTEYTISKSTSSALKKKTVKTTKKTHHATPYYPSDVVEAKEVVQQLEYINAQEYLPSAVKMEQEKYNSEFTTLNDNEATLVATTPETPVAATNTGQQNTKFTNIPTPYYYYDDRELTAYCATGNVCADGAYPSVGYTCASNDPNLWHKWIYIEGVGTRYVHDTGGMSRNVIDIFMSDRGTCINFGRRHAKIYVYY